MVPLIAASVATAIGKIAGGAHAIWEQAAAASSGSGKARSASADSFEALLSAHGVTSNIQRATAGSALPTLDATAHRLVNRVA